MRNKGYQRKSGKIKGYQRFVKILTSYLLNPISSILFFTAYCLLSTAYFLFAQGYIYWPENGIKISNKDAYPSDIVSDDKDGAIVILNGADSVYAQRVDGNGNLLWGPDGKGVGSTPMLTGNGKAVSDGKGGVIVVWERWSSPEDIKDLFCQRLDSTGMKMWNPNGVMICEADSDQVYPAIVSDGAGGAIIAWEDYRNGGYGNSDIYAQRVDSVGNVRWQMNGVPVCTTAWRQERPAICSDGVKGAVIVWNDLATDIYAQRIDSNGVTKWGVNGASICATANFEGGPTLDLVDTNSIVVAWMDNRNGNFDIYGQRVNFNADTLWPGGVAICTAESLQGGYKF